MYSVNLFEIIFESVQLKRKFVVLVLNVFQLPL